MGDGDRYPASLADGALRAFFMFAHGALAAPGDAMSGGDSHMTRVRGVVLEDAMVALATIGGFENPYSRRAADGPPVDFGQDLLGTCFERCQFHQSMRGFEKGFPQDADSNQDIMRLRATHYLRDGIYARANKHAPCRSSTAPGAASCGRAYAPTAAGSRSPAATSR